MDIFMIGPMALNIYTFEFILVSVVTVLFYCFFRGTPAFSIYFSKLLKLEIISSNIYVKKNLCFRIKKKKKNPHQIWGYKHRILFI